MNKNKSDAYVFWGGILFFFVLYMIGKSGDCNMPGCTRTKTSGSNYCYTHSNKYDYSSYKSGSNGSNIHKCSKSGCSRVATSGSSYCTYHKSSANTKNSYTYNYHSSGSSSSTKKYDPYDVYDYHDADDFADDWGDEFDDWDGAWDYYDEHH